MNYNYDVIFIGGGHATIHGANILNAADKKVLIVEKNRMGGTCTTYGCDPKILLDAPFEIMDQVARYDKKGIVRKSEIEKMIFAFPATTWGIFNFFLNNVLVD